MPSDFPLCALPWVPLKYSPVRQGDKGLDNLGDVICSPGIESQASHIHWLAEAYHLVI